MGEGVFADDRFVGLGLDAGDGGDEAAGGVNFAGVDPGFDVVEDITADFEGHDDLLQGRVSGPLSQAVDGALHLPGAVLDGGERVGDGEAQVVVVVDRDDGPVADEGFEFGDAGSDFIGQKDADGVGDIDRSGSRVDRGVDDLFHKAHLAASGVFEAELHVVDEGPGILHRLHGPFDHLLGFHPQLVLHMDGAGGDEGVDPLFWRGGDGVTGGFDILFQGPGQGADGRGLDPLSDAVDGVEIPGARRGEARLDDVHAQLLELAGDLDLLFGVHGGAGALLPVTEGGVENDDMLFTHFLAFIDVVSLESWPILSKMG